MARVAVGGLFALGALTGCVTETAADRPVEFDLVAAREQIAELEESIARDRHSLEDLVSEPREEDGAELHEDATLRELAERITREARRLEQLRGQMGEAASRR